MKKLAVMQYAIVAVMAGLVIGCAAGGKGASDAEQITGVLTAWKAAIQAKDIDAMLATCSENFSHDGTDYQAGDREKLRDFVEGAIDMKYLDNVEISFQGAKKNIEGNKAVVYPIDYSNVAGAVTMELTLAKEKKGWLITDMKIEGL